MKILRLNEFNNEILYHGSSNKHDVLLPFPSNVINGEKAVFATNKRWLSLCFIPKFNDSDIEIGYVNDIPYVEELKEGAFDLLKISGYTHIVSSKGFKKDSRLGMNNVEYIKRGSANVEEIEEIDDVFSELKKSEVYMIPYDLVMMIRDQKFRTNQS
jgi:hypothetical protein